ncbi:hypothetical protein [Desulfocastanea catecholica]
MIRGKIECSIGQDVSPKAGAFEGQILFSGIKEEECLGIDILPGTIYPSAVTRCGQNSPVYYLFMADKYRVRQIP